MPQLRCPAGKIRGGVPRIWEATYALRREGLLWDEVDVNPFFGDYQAIAPYIYNLPVGKRVPLHKHPTTDELFFVLKGRIKFKVGEKEIVAIKGDLVQGRMDVPHSFENIGDEPAFFLSVKGPKPVDLVMLEDTKEGK